MGEQDAATRAAIEALNSPAYSKIFRSIVVSEEARGRQLKGMQKERAEWKRVEQRVDQKSSKKRKGRKYKNRRNRKRPREDQLETFHQARLSGQQALVIFEC